MDSLEFLNTVWADQSGYVFLPRKRKRWVEGPAIEWPPEEAFDLSDFLHGDADSYYSIQTFSHPERRKEYVRPSPWLYADLDTVDPRKLDLRPTIAIQSSPGRFQGLWRLNRRVSAQRLERVNKRLTYVLGADRGGWDLTQVLRIPGTPNLKYPTRTLVKVLWFDSSTSSRYSLGEVERWLDSTEGNLPGDRSESDGGRVEGYQPPSRSREQILRAIWPDASERLRGLIDGNVRTGDEGRSGLLWEMECRLLEAGLTDAEVFVVARSSDYNKYLDRSDGDKQLWSEIQKAVLHVGVSEPTTSSDSRTSGRKRLRVLEYSTLLGSNISEPQWLIEDWWTMGSHGIVAGLPKSYKSLVSLDMAVSISSATPFLGRYDVNPKGAGPVLVIQQENSLPLLRDRLVKISHSRGLNTGSAKVKDANTVAVTLPPALPLFFYNDFGFDMTMPADRELVENIIQEEGIKMVQFDPLYLMMGGVNENQAQEIRPILNWLLRLRNLYQCAVVVVHHWGKGNSDRTGRGQGGQKLLGSTTIYGWLEAALYLEAKHLESGIQVVAEREFRERMSPPPLTMNLSMGDVGEMGYSWNSLGPAGEKNDVLRAIQAAGDKGATQAWIRKQTESGQKKVRSELDGLIGSGLVVMKMGEDGRTQRYYIA